MFSILMRDVGDGMCLSLSSSPPAQILTIDCGCQQDYGRNAYEQLQKSELSSFHFYNTRCFLLSHLHADHYNGLLWYAKKVILSEQNQIKLDKIFIPQLPKIPNNREKEFLKCICAYNHYILGDESGSMEYDFLNLIRIINSKKDFEIAPLKRGEIVPFSHYPAEIIWPPDSIDNTNFAKSVENAIRIFNEELEKNPTLKNIYEKLSSEELSSYLGLREKIKNDKEPTVDNLKKELKGYPRVKHHQRLSDVNGKLRGIANRISVAFIQNGILNFMGDLEAYEINKVISYLRTTKNIESTELLITPHHGTHWGKDLDTYRCNYALSSFGKKLAGNFCKQYITISKYSIATHSNGSILIDLRAKMNYKRRY